jgi:glucosyltransferase GtrII-like protein
MPIQSPSFGLLPPPQSSKKWPAGDSVGVGTLVSDYKSVFLVGCLASVVAHGEVIFQPLYSIDSYYAQYISWPYSAILSQGRFGEVALRWILDVVGYFGLGVAVSAAMVSVALFSAGAILFALSIFEASQKSGVLIFVALVVLHPFGTEFFHFDEATLLFAIAFFTGSAGVYLALRGTSVWCHSIAATSLMVLQLSIYQSFISCISATCIMAMVSKLVSNEIRTVKDILYSAPTRALCVTAGSVGVYGLLLLFIRILFGIPVDGRMDLSALLTPAGLLSKFSSLNVALDSFFWPTAGLLSKFGSILLALLIMSSVGLVLLKTARAGRIIHAVVATVLMCGGVIGSLFPQLAGQIVWLVPRVLWPAIVPVSAILSLGWICLPVRARPLAVLSLLILCLAFVGGSNRIIFDQRRVNLWDVNQANRMIARLEPQSGFTRITTMAMVGGDWRRTAALPTATGDMNISAFSARLAQLGVIQEATGYRFYVPTEEQSLAANEYCRSAETWPAEGSAVVIGSVAVVCLTKDQGP